MKVKVYATVTETFNFILTWNEGETLNQLIERAQEEANEENDGLISVPRIEIFDEVGNTLHNDT